MRVRYWISMWPTTMWYKAWVETMGGRGTCSWLSADLIADFPWIHANHVWTEGPLSIFLPFIAMRLNAKMGEMAFNNVKAAFSLFFDLSSDLFCHSFCWQMKEFSHWCSAMTEKVLSAFLSPVVKHDIINTERQHQALNQYVVRCIYLLKPKYNVVS